MPIARSVTFVFTPAVQKMRELTLSGELGDIQYYDLVRINLGLLQHDVMPTWTRCTNAP